jgi:hypothetical protein
MEFNTTSYGVAKVNKTTYTDGNLAILLTDDMGGPLAKLSVNLPEHSEFLEENQFFAKTYAENEEIAKDALKSGFFRELDKAIMSGWVTFPVWEVIENGS